jgi:hypothetical protein
MLKRGLSEAIKTNLLVGELELVAERIAQHHLQKPCRVSWEMPYEDSCRNIKGMS